MVNITRERAQEIISLYNLKDSDGHRKKSDLFNWCEEYKTFISSCVSACVSYEVEYILKKSYEDNEAPLSYEDLDLFDIDKAKESVLYKFDEMTAEEANNFIDKTNEEYKRRICHKGDVEVFLNSLSQDELKKFCDNSGIDRSETDGEVYEWWIIQDPLKYRLEQQGEIFLNGACCTFWGRCTTGQSISLDSCCMNAFINLLKDIVQR